MEPYYCPKCRRNHRWDSEVGANHRNHTILLNEFEMEGAMIREYLMTHPYNPLSIQYRQWFIIVQGKTLWYRGTIEEEWLTWDGKDVQGKPTTPMGYPKKEYR